MLAESIPDLKQVSSVLKTTVKAIISQIGVEAFNLFKAFPKMNRSAF